MSALRISDSPITRRIPGDPGFCLANKEKRPLQGGCGCTLAERLEAAPNCKLIAVSSRAGNKDITTFQLISLAPFDYAEFLHKQQVSGKHVKVFGETFKHFIEIVKASRPVLAGELDRVSRCTELYEFCQRHKATIFELF